MSKIRYAVESPQGQENLRVLAKGISLMKELPIDDPFSLAYQAGLHGSNAKELEGKSFINSCPHFNKSGDGNDNAHFLAWHGLYLHHFEEAVSAITNRADFSLPYWNYSDPDQRKLPVAFRDPNQGGIPGLFDAKRASYINDGTKDVHDNMDTLLKQLEEAKDAPFFVFSKTLELGIHNNIHVNIGYDKITGERGTMLPVTTAALDPIFWVHHANVDRLWKSISNTRLTAEGLGAKPPGQIYGFFDANKNPVQYNYAEAADLNYNLPISYDAAYNPFDPNTGEEAIFEADGLIFTQSVNLSIGQLRSSDITLASAFDAVPKDGKATILELEVEIHNEPKGGYIDIFFGDSSAKQDELLNGSDLNFDELFSNPEDETFLEQHYAGSISFFPHDIEEDAHENDHSEHTKQDSFWADISNEVISAGNDPLIEDFLHFHVDQDQEELNELQAIIVKAINIYEM